jgi:hypothetical protein
MFAAFSSPSLAYNVPFSGQCSVCSSTLWRVRKSTILVEVCLLDPFVIGQLRRRYTTPHTIDERLLLRLVHGIHGRPLSVARMPAGQWRQGTVGVCEGGEMDGFQVKNGQCERLIFLRETPNSSVERDRYDVRPPLDGFGGVDRLISEAPHGRPAFDVIVLSHLRWDFVFQRPQHLLSRCARQHRVFFVEEPITTDGPAWMDVSTPRPGVWVAAPHLPEGVSACEAEAIQHHLLDALIAEYRVRSYVLWYYTPMAMAFSRHLDPLATV